MARVEQGIVDQRLAGIRSSLSRESGSLVHKAAYFRAAEAYFALSRILGIYQGDPQALSVVATLVYAFGWNKRENTGLEIKDFAIVRPPISLTESGLHPLVTRIIERNPNLQVHWQKHRGLNEWPRFEREVRDFATAADFVLEETDPEKRLLVIDPYYTSKLAVGKALIFDPVGNEAPIREIDLRQKIERDNQRYQGKFYSMRFTNSQTLRSITY